jgi:uncharacterized protein CbrC (UPF0167 family)
VIDSASQPTFTYYEDPYSDGTIEESDVECAGCSRRRGLIATCVAYGADVPDEASFCPWCVADGTAHTNFGAFFNEVDAGAATEAQQEVEFRTPGFDTWQDWSWPTHCGDVGVYRGQPTGAELRANPDALAALLRILREWPWGRDATFVDEFIDGLGGSAVAYLFTCRHCGIALVTWDSD